MREITGCQPDACGNGPTSGRPRTVRSPGLERFLPGGQLLRCQRVGDVDGEISVETVFLLCKFERATEMNFVLAGGERVHEDEVPIAGGSGRATRLRRGLRRPGVRHGFEDPIGTRRKEIDLWIDEPKRARPGKTGTVNLEEHLL